MRKTTGDKRKYFPLTHAQKRIYYDTILHPDAPWANIGFLVKYEEKLDFVLLVQAINKVIRKNDGLRLRIVQFDYEPEPKQYVSEYREISLDSINFSSPYSERRVQEWAEKTTSKVFQLIDNDLFYFAFINLDEIKSGYYLKIHHLVADGWSCFLLFTEINKIYETLKAGNPIDESPNPSYIQYIADEQEYLKSEQVKEDKEFWHKTLLPLPKPVDLSSKKGDINNIKAKKFALVFPDNLRTKMHEYCSPPKTSLYKLVLSALSIYVSGITGMDDFVFGGVNHGRSEEIYKKIVGMFVSTLSIRINIDGDMTFHELVEKTGTEINNIIKNHQRYPYDILATELKENSGSDTGYLRNITLIGHSDVKKKSFNYDYFSGGFEPEALLMHLNISNKDKDGILEMEYVYQLEQFSESDIMRIHQGLVNVLTNAFVNPEKRILEIELISGEEKQQVLYEFNNTFVDYPKDKTIHELFETHVEKKTGNIALSYRDKKLTYGELNEKSNQLARLLREKGVKVGHVIGIMAERSLEMIIGIMAILKAGGVYLPLDPEYPETRLRYLLKDSSSKLLLTREKHVGSVKFDGEVIKLEEESLYQGESGNSENLNSTGDLAYIIYTSGSTGMPKGVVIQHRSAVNLLLALNEIYPLEEADTYLLKTAFLFDVSVSEIFGWFWRGGRLTILEPGAEKNPYQILETIKEEKVTHINFVPSMFNLFVNTLDNKNIEQLSSLKYIFLAGEAIWPSSILRFRELGSRVVIENLYGPTEATVYAARFPVAKWKGAGSIPIGIPIDNLKLFIIGAKESTSHTLQSVGAAGELTISGIGLAGGYLNRPELTSEKFIDNPFAKKVDLDISFKKLYRTGDLARWMPDGNIEYLGRIDHQVKVRGFRIETGEIESQILKQEDQRIKGAVVLAREDTAGEKYLCAYIVADEKIDTTTLRDTLSKNVMDYMIPSYFVQVEKIPLSPSGKVDRKTLPDPKIKARGESYAAPRNEIEKKLTEIWAEILNMDKSVIGIDDNFFKIGGHSLKAAVLIAEIHKAFNVKVLMHEIFGMPMVRRLAGYIKEAKREKYSAINPVPKDKYYPLSSTQKRLYLLNLMEPESISYNMPILYLPEEEPDRARLENAFNELVKRHESFRTSFEMIEKNLVQEIHEDVNVEIRYYDIPSLVIDNGKSKVPSAEAESIIKEVMKSFVRPFNLSMPPLLRPGLLKGKEGKWLLMVDMHHIISDGISLEIFRKDLIELYEQKDLPPLKIQYKDYAVWQNKERKEKVLKQEEEKYWLGVFKGEIPVLNLPLDYARPAVQSFEGTLAFFELAQEDAFELNNLAKKENATLFMVLTVIFNVLLNKLSGQEDIVVGTPVGGRRHSDLENIIGMFVNTLALRNQPFGEKTFAEFLKELRKTTLDAFENQDYPFEELVELLDIERDVSRNPLFDVMFVLQNMAAKEVDTYSLKIKPYRYRRTTSKFDMTLFAEETGNGLFFEWEYGTKLFKEETIERLITYFKNIIAAVIKTPQTKISNIEMMPAKEKREILYDLNDTEAGLPANKTIHEIVEARVKETPENIALVFRGKNLTYRQLNNRANQLARVLREKGVNREYIVGLMVDRSMEMIIGMLAVLKAGGAYLPIEPEYPENRISYMLRDSKSRLILTQEAYIGRTDFNGEAINLEEVSLYQGEGPDPDRVNSPKDLAYIIYTSGSTGLPKGVLINHDSVINLAFSQQKTFAIDEKERIFQFSSMCFDASVEQIYIALFSGAALVLIDKEVLLDMNKFEEFIDDNELTHIHGVPAFVSTIPVKKYKNLKRMIAGGDLCSPLLVRKWIKYCDFCNEYGPTETTVTSIELLLKKSEKLQYPLSIGRPLDNTFIYILDKYMYPVPLGVAGELCIGGDGVARGYLNNPELTAEKFLADCYRSYRTYRTYIPSKKIYRTGDLARWLPDGNIDFLGRIDFQVKIRGFRIETGEIENRILTQKEQKINHAVVIPREDIAGDKYLCAYIVSDKKIDISMLEDSLSENLPDYMIPSCFVQVEHIPLSSTGKVNRKALPAPEIREKGANYMAPRNEIEEKLAAIWSELLHLEKDVIGIDDNFFKLGGHSLKAAVMITVIHKELNVKVSMHRVFEMPTIRKLGEYIKGAREEEFSSIEPVEEKEYYPQTSAQKRLYFIEQLEKNSILYNIQLMDLYCKGVEREALEEAFRSLIKRHESLRTSFFTVDGQAVQRIHECEEVCSNFEFEYYETTEDGLIFSEQPGKEWTKMPGLPFQDVIEQFVQPFDLTHPPLIRASLIKIWGNTRILMLDMHHIISDGVSNVTLIKDLWTLYDEKEIPGLRVQYKDFAEWVIREEHTKAIAKQEIFWLKEFSCEVPALNLPYDYPRPAKLTFDGDMLHFEISKEETRKLNVIAREQGQTLYMVLFSLYYILLAKITGQEDIVVGTVTAGRGHADLQPLIGMFVDTLAVRNYPESDKKIQDFLGEVREKILAAFENQGYPFEQLVNKVSPRQDASRNPLFDVVFVFENEAERSEEYLHDVLMLDRSNPYNIRRAKFDMTLSGAETGEDLQFNIEFNTQLFNVETIERFIDYYKKIVSSICKDCDQKISEIEIIPDLERGLLLYGFNDTESLYPGDKTIHELFEEQAAKNPDNTALKGMAYSPWGMELTYRELNEKVNPLARLLRKKGVLADDIAAIMVEPSQEMIIGLLAILKAGGVFLPIDHKIPGDRKKYILEESGTRYLLSREELLEEIPFAGEIIKLDNTDIYKGDEGNPEPVNTPGDIAYVIYTSGSTGKPKGVMVEHRSLANLCCWHNIYYSVTARDRATKYAGFGFDASVWEVFPYLVIGAALHIVPEEIKLDVKALNRYFEDNGITISFLPTQLCEQFMTIDNPSLRVLLTGGDKLKTFTKKNYQLFNNYGPTENTVVATSFPVSRFKSNIPIGKPVYNNQIYILDSSDNLQPIGVPGELCISGDSLARGYLNNPELTMEKFTANPYAPPAAFQLDGNRLYRTGDLVRWLADGNIEFLGRIDYQVKIRGFRIELGEIENRLLRIEDIKAAVVIAREDSPGQKYLTAYIVPQNTGVNVELVRESLAKNLPEYMIPAYFVQMDRIPLNPSGKIDTKALPKPEVKGIEYAAPTTDTEKRLAETWSGVLGIEKIGIDDNFFNSGGDSIKTIMVTARLQKHGIVVNINDFFSNPTIRQLARHVKKTEPETEKKIAAIKRDEEFIAGQIKKDYEKYLQRIGQEKWPGLKARNRYKHILLTGATGYLGAYLLVELLNNTEAVLVLPVRGKTQTEAEERLKKRLSFYFGWDFFASQKERIVVIKADLRKEQMGIEDENLYKKLCAAVNCVVHSAANVKHYGAYEELYKDNVEGTERLLEFAITGKKKDFHYISTISVGLGEIPDREYNVFTEYNHDVGQKTGLVYTKSKFEAERRVLAYREKGIDTSIYRAGNLTFHSETGRFQENIQENAFYSMIKAVVKVGFLSQKMKALQFDLSFINHAARAITLLLTTKGLKNETYHIINPDSLSLKEIAEWIRESGVEILEVEEGKIEEHLAQFEGRSEYERIIERVKLDSWAWEEQPATLTEPKIDRTVMLLKKLGFEWPKVTRQHIEKMIAHSRERSFL